MNEYKKLDKSLNEDIEKLRELAGAINERAMLKKRIDYLNELIRDNEDCTKAIWTTAQGVSLVIADIPDDHLKNIGTHLVRHNGTNSRIYKEIMKRFGPEGLPSGLSEEDEDECFF